MRTRERARTLSSNVMRSQISSPVEGEGVGEDSDDGSHRAIHKDYYSRFQVVQSIQVGITRSRHGSSLSPACVQSNPQASRQMLVVIAMGGELEPPHFSCVSSVRLEVEDNRLAGRELFEESQLLIAEPAKHPMQRGRPRHRRHPQVKWSPVDEIPHVHLVSVLWLKLTML
ncbi:hypothetical protein CYLTODRAFT_18448 [Cylindrobasidium torrendii FP15055 ss-10]|uniref:Uncharacterized protein n=1 Tax=Cylindrobasidium torrendii FP15055 ss-10 TaxID=1314674 RepID=A0A0D7BQD0_9AGAR|nr:hypothetical protein CYLTODRAFT_18448 [Cylindrobasidium torrendii FP15055 ss-10]